MSHTVTIADVEVDVRVVKIADRVFEALATSKDTAFIVKGVSPQDALQRLKIAIERKMAG